MSQRTEPQQRPKLSGFLDDSSWGFTPKIKG
jgi:hypothetical protein